MNTKAWLLTLLGLLGLALSVQAAVASLGPIQAKAPDAAIDCHLLTEAECRAFGDELNRHPHGEAHERTMQALRAIHDERDGACNPKNLDAQIVYWPNRPQQPAI